MFLPSNITLQFGDSGDFVRELQRRLGLVKCFGEDMINGFYDGNTVNGVTRFQAMVGLHADGVAGPETLRRLNGVIAGGGSTTDKKEEEKDPTKATMHAMHVLYGNAPPPQDPTVWGEKTPEQQQKPPVQQAELPPPQPVNPQLQQQEQAKQAEQLQQQQSQPLQDQSLAAMLLSQPQQRHEPPPLERPTERPPLKPEQTASPERDKLAAEQAEQAREPKGILGRVIKFANATLQRLADYFEAKLPPSVLGEVRDLGSVMARNGVKEAPIPMSPEMARLPQTPARGPEQAQRV